MMIGMDTREPYRIYQELAEREGERQAAQLRDRFLVLAADAALTAGKDQEAEHLSDLLLTVNPLHLLKPFPSFKEAMQSPEVSAYVADLRRSYPPDEAARLLEALHGPTPEPPPPADAPPPLSPPRVEPEPIAPAVHVPGAPSPFMPEAAPPRIPPVYRPEPAPPAQSEPDEETVPSRVSHVVATGLFVIVLAATLALAGHVLVRPFVP
jgi:hypothetical protein